jgi:ATP-dependent HslUV protease ATP-binding subunit HslU
MVFYMPGQVEAQADDASELMPKQIVSELDRFIVGQHKAKRAVAIALRNRVRRRKLSPEMAEEVTPKNILMIGPTGVGKTEIARRLARLSGSPFIKVEASKFTEVGYVGRDVESMVRDLVEIGIDLVRQERRAQVTDRARLAVQQRILDLLLPPRPARPARTADATAEARERQEKESWERSRQTLKRRLEAGELEERVVEIESTSAPMTGMRFFGAGGMEEMDMNLKDMLPGLFQGKPRQRKMSVAEARDVLQREEEDRLIDPEQISRGAISRVEQSGIIFVDEMDKIAGREGGHGPDVSREGVQRDLLPIVEGTLVHTKHGMVRTDHILFVAAGAFHVSKPSDLIPELQGRFPIRVELDSLGRDELVRILTEPESSLVRQYHALMETEGVELVFHEDGIAAIAEAATTVNSQTENIGARRLATIMERLLDEISFAGSELAGRRVVIDGPYVRERLDDITQDTDLSRFIL